MRINLTSVLVEDQQKALEFYTNILGFAVKMDLPLGEFRWLTVVSPEAPHEPELLLEPNVFPAAKVYQAALKAGGIAAASFGVDDVHSEYERLTALGVIFKVPPQSMGPVTIAVFEDTCGNLIQITAHK